MVTMVTLSQTYVLGDVSYGELEKMGKGHHSHHSVVMWWWGGGGGVVTVGRWWWGGDGGDLILNLCSGICFVWGTRKDGKRSP